MLELRQFFSSVNSVSNSLTHSLLRLTSEGHNERSCADDHSKSIVHPWSSSTCCIQVFLGRPGGRFQSAAGYLPCERLTQCWRMLWAGTSGGRRQTCPSNECLLSAMMRGRSVSFIWFRTESLVTKSCHFMFSMRRCAFMWKACSRAESALVSNRTIKISRQSFTTTDDFVTNIFLKTLFTT